VPVAGHDVQVWPQVHPLVHYEGGCVPDILIDIQEVQMTIKLLGNFLLILGHFLKLIKLIILINPSLSIITSCPFILRVIPRCTPRTPIHSLHDPLLPFLLVFKLKNLLKILIRILIKSLIMVQF
jgi:hypothetical protein